MKRTVFLLIVMVLSSLLFVQCKKCKTEELSDKNFTAEDLAIVPYNGTEKLTFKNEVGDSICFTGQGRSSTMNVTYEVRDWDGEECHGDHRMVEFNKIEFTCDNADTTIAVYLRFHHPFNETENEKHILIEWEHSDNNASPEFFGIYTFYSDTIKSPESYPDSYYGIILNYYGSYYPLHIGNKTFTRVYEMTYFDSFGFSIYYSVSQGIVGFKERSGTVWYLDRMY